MRSGSLSPVAGTRMERATATPGIHAGRAPPPSRRCCAPRRLVQSEVASAHKRAISALLPPHAETLLPGQLRELEDFTGHIGFAAGTAYVKVFGLFGETGEAIQCELDGGVCLSMAGPFVCWLDDSVRDGQRTGGRDFPSRRVVASRHGGGGGREGDRSVSGWRTACRRERVARE